VLTARYRHFLYGTGNNTKNASEYSLPKYQTKLITGAQIMKRSSQLKLAAALAVSLGATLAQAQITDGLVVHLPFDNAYTNSQPTGIDGTAVGSPTFGAGKIGQAVALTTLRDGSVINYVTLGYPSLLKFGSVTDGTAVDFSIAFWCNYTNQIDDPAFISNKNWGSSNNKGWGIFTQGSGVSRINTTDDRGSSGKQSTTATPVVRDGTWHHMVVTWVRTNAVNVYVDGTLRTTSSLLNTTGSIDTDDLGYAVNIGEDGTGTYTDGGSAEMVNVLMDDLGIWRRALSPGEVTAIYNAGLGGTNLANVPAIVNPYLNTTTPSSAATGVPPNQPTITAVLVDGLNAVGAGTISFKLNGAAVPVSTSKSGPNTTVTYTSTGVLPGGLNTATIVFGNNAAPQRFFTNTWTFTVASYVTLTPDLRVTADLSKPGFVFNIFANQANKDNSTAKTEAALAGQLVDADGNPLPNLADPTAQGPALAPGVVSSASNAPIRFEIASTINLNADFGVSTGNFPNDNLIPGLPATDTVNDGAAAEILTYLDLPAGLTIMGVNSDDGFRTQVGKSPQDTLQAITAGEFNGARGIGDTIFYIYVQQAGVYPFRTTWENGTSTAELEWYTIKTDNTKVLVNDTANGGVAAYRALTTATSPYVKYVSPAPVQRQVNQPSRALTVVLNDGSTAVDTTAVTLKLDGVTLPVTPVRSGSLVTLTYTPNNFQSPEVQHQAEVIFKNVGGTVTVDSKWTFLNLKNVVLPAPAIFENFDSYTPGEIPTGWAETNYTDTDLAGLDLGNLHSDSFKGWVVMGRDSLLALKSRIFNGPAAGQLSNGVPVTSLASGNMLYAESDVRNGRQVQFLYSKAYNLSAVPNVAVGFASLYEQNQNSSGSVEYSVDGGKSWLPVVYYLDYVDGGGDIRVSADTTVDAVQTFTAPNGDAPTWSVNGVAKGGNYGDGLAAPITQALGRFVAPRANDDSVEGKRFEVYRLPLAGGKSDVRLRFGQLGNGSWYFGVDDLGFYNVGAPVAPQISLAKGGANGAVLSWIGAGTLLESTSVNGPWTVSASQVNPQTPVIGAGAKYYRVGGP